MFIQVAFNRLGFQRFRIPAAKDSRKASSSHTFLQNPENRPVVTLAECPTFPSVFRHSLSVPENGRAEQSGTDLGVAAESARFGDASKQPFTGLDPGGHRTEIARTVRRMTARIARKA